MNWWVGSWIQYIKNSRKFKRVKTLRKTKAELRKIATGKKPTPETRKLLSKLIKARDPSTWSSKKVEVTNLKTGEKVIFSSFRKAAASLSIDLNTIILRLLISRVKNLDIAYKNIYLFKFFDNTPLDLTPAIAKRLEKLIIKNNSLEQSKSFAVRVEDMLTGETFNFGTITEAVKILKIDYKTIRNIDFKHVNKLVRNRYLFYLD